MARPPLPLGTHGNIWVVKRGDGYLARCRYRDMDGTTRYLERAASSKTAANRKLQDALRAFRGPTDEPLRAEHRFERAATLWLTKVDAWVADGSLADTTADRYRHRLDKIVLPALGQLQLCECTVGRVDAFFARSTPNRSLCSMTNVTSVAVEGRAPSRRKPRPPSKSR